MLNLQQKQSLQQKLSPQQIQYIKLLQLPTLELEMRIKEEMEMNPLLEEGEEEEEEITTEADEPPQAEAADESEREPEGNDDEEFDWDEFLNSPDDLYGYKARVDHSAEEDQREIPMPYKSSMAEHLRDQIGMLDFDETQDLIAEQIIGSIDEDGYLRRPIESIVDDIMFSQGLMLTDDDVEDVLKRLQRLDPVGIASRDLRECMLVQLEAMPDDVDGRGQPRQIEGLVQGDIVVRAALRVTARDGALIGIVTMSDIQKVLPLRRDREDEESSTQLALSAHQVYEVMTSDPVCVSSEETIQDVAEVMLENQISGIPIIQAGKLVGIVTESDIFALIVETWGDLVPQ